VSLVEAAATRAAKVVGAVHFGDDDDYVDDPVNLVNDKDIAAKRQIADEAGFAAGGCTLNQVDP
jgi:hypothetical protein